MNNPPRFSAHTTSAGFTLIELMITVAIIGVLAAVALPSYQEYSVRAKLSEAIAATSPCKVEQTENYVVGVLPDENNYSACHTDPAVQVSRYVKQIRLQSQNGVHVQVTGTGLPTVDDKWFHIIPLSETGDPMSLPTDAGKRIAAWRCEPDSSPAHAVPLKYLPSSCRG